MNKMCFCIAICAMLLIACNNNAEQSIPVPETVLNNTSSVINYTVVARFAHDTTSFTEGFLVHNEQLFESTGHTDSYASSRSLFGAVDMSSGKINVKAEIDKTKYFGEGIVFLKDKVYQLTEKTMIGFIYDSANYKKTGEFHYEGEGWGLTTNGNYLIMSNGSSNIIYRDPITFKPVKSLNVTDNNGPVSNINELELIHGFIYANQWLTDYILKIDTSSGKVLGKLDLSSLKAAAKSAYQGSIETNGIAFDALANKIYVTGKLWPFIYEIKFVH
jgi:glutamine cyclotransferase